MTTAPPQAQDALFALFAVKLDLVSENAVERALSKLTEGQRLRDVLVEAGKLTAEQAERAEAACDPEVIPGYRIEGEAGRGGMGVVYQARQLSMDRPVALKVLTRRLSRDEAYVAKFLEEARSAAKLNHENIVAAIDAGEAEGLHYFVMEFVDGASVEEVMSEQGPLEWELALEVAEQVAMALEHAHEAGLVHRDVKPENVLMSGDGQAKLCDLGLAKPSQVAGTGEKAAMTEGTPYYCSPEQALGRTDIDPRSDVYSLGVTLFTMIAGAPPFDGDSARAILLKQVKQPFPDLATALPQVPEDVRAVIASMVVKERENRLGGMREFREALAAAREDRPGAPTSRGRRRGGGANAAAIGVVIVLVVVAAVVLSNLLKGDSEEETGKTVAVASPNPGGSQTPDPGPSPAVSERPSPSAGGSTSELAQARDAYDAALAFQRENPGDTAGQRRHFRKVADDYPGTGYAAQAEDRIASLSKSAKVGVTHALDALSTQVMAHLSRSEAREALALIETFRTSWKQKGATNLDQQLEPIEGRVRRSALALLDGHLAALEGDRGGPDSRSQAEALLPLVPEAARRAAKARLVAIDRANARAGFRNLETKVSTALTRGDVASARAALDAAKGDRRLAPFADAVAQLERDVSGCEGASARFNAWVRGLPRQAEITFQLVNGSKLVGRFNELDPRTLAGTFKPNGEEARPLHLREVSAVQLVAQALPASEGRGNVLHFLTAGLPHAAKRALSEYVAAGGKADAILERRVAQAIARLADKAFAQRLQPLLDPATPPVDVIKGIRDLTREAGLLSSGTYKASYEQLKQAYTRARLAQIQADETALFNGAVEKDRKGRVKLTYDFSSVDQLRDFAADKGAHKASKRRRISGALAVSGVVHLQARFSPGLLKVEFKATPSNKRKPNLNLILSPDAGAWAGVLCGAGFAYSDIANLKIDPNAKKRAGYIIDVPAHVLIELGGKPPSRRMPGVMSASNKAKIKSSSPTKISLTRSEKGVLKFKIGSRSPFSLPSERGNRPGRVSFAPFATEMRITELEVWGRLDPEWVKTRGQAVATEEAAALPKPR